MEEKIVSKIRSCEEDLLLLPPPSLLSEKVSGGGSGGETSRATVDEVDTTLSLGRGDAETSAAAAARAYIRSPEVVGYNPTPSRCWLPDLNLPACDDDFDTTFSSRMPEKRRRDEAETSATAAARADIRQPVVVVYNPMPIRWCLPDLNPYDDDLDTPFIIRMREKRNRDEAETGAASNEGRRKRRRRRVIGGDDQLPLVPIEQIQGLIEMVQQRGGTRPPRFLYRKKLQDSDVKKDQNRLFVTWEVEVMKFLEEEEVAAVDHGRKGLKIVGVDGGGKVYENLAVKRWESLQMLVINNSDWGKLVAANNAEKGDVIEIWGYRENGKPCFAFNFRRENGA